MPRQRQAWKHVNNVENVINKNENNVNKDENQPKRGCPADFQKRFIVEPVWIRNMELLFKAKEALTPLEQQDFLFKPMNIPESNADVPQFSRVDFIRCEILQTGIDSFKELRDLMLKNSSCGNKHLFSRMLAFDEVQRSIPKLIKSAVNTSKSFFDKEIVSLLESRIGQDIVGKFEEFYSDFCYQEDHPRIHGEETIVNEENDSGDNVISEVLASKKTRDKEKKEPPKMSEELRLKIQKMYASLPPKHEVVYPPPPPPGALTIPTGGLAKCQCKESCNVELAEPAYRIVTKEELEQFWLITTEENENTKKADTSRIKRR